MKLNTIQTCMLATIITSLALVVALPVYAEDGTTSTSSKRIAPLRQEIERERQELRASSTEARKEFEDKLKSERKEFVASSTAALRARVEESKGILKENIEKRKAELESKLNEKKDAKKQKLDEKAKARVQAASDRIFANFNKKIANLNQVDVRLTALAQASSTASTTALLTTAKAALVQAKTDISAAQAVVQSQISTSTTAANIRTLVQTAEKSVQAAGLAYRKVAIALGLPADIKREAEDKTASSTTR